MLVVHRSKWPWAIVPVELGADIYKHFTLSLGYHTVNGGCFLLFSFHIYYPNIFVIKIVDNQEVYMPWVKKMLSC